MIKSSGNIFADLGYQKPEAENLKVRAQLMAECVSFIERRALSQAEAGRALGLTQPQVSDLVRGRIEKFTVDRLINALTCAGAHVSVKVA